MSIELLGGGAKRRYKVRWREGNSARSRTFDRKADARLFEAEVRRRNQTGDLVSVNRSPRLDDYAGHWWDEHVEPKLKLTTQKIYAVQLDLRILPELGGYRLREITPGMVQSLLTRCTKEGVGDPSVVKTATVLQSIFRLATIEGLVERNPVQPVRKPSQRRKRELDIIAPTTVERIRAQLSRRLRAGCSSRSEARATPLVTASICLEPSRRDRAHGPRLLSRLSELRDPPTVRTRQGLARTSTSFTKFAFSRSTGWTATTPHGFCLDLNLLGGLLGRWPFDGAA